MTIYSKERAIKDYSAELAGYRNDKASGTKMVSASGAGEKLAAGRKEVPIDEVIKDWADGLAKLELLPPKADAEDFNY